MSGRDATGDQERDTMPSQNWIQAPKIPSRPMDGGPAEAA
jgi:hypothetical protein